MKINFKLITVIALYMTFLVFAASGLEGTLIEICDMLMGLVGPLAYLLVSAAAVVYIFGQFGDAQMRARANTWAQSCIMGAVMGWLIITLVPVFLGALIAASGVAIDASSAGSGACGQMISDMAPPFIFF